MNILNKEFSKYSKPVFFKVGRVMGYFLGIFMIAGAYTRMQDSEFLLVNFYVLVFLLIVVFTVDLINALKKRKTYSSHLVKLTEEYVLYVDHKGQFKLRYEDISSYQLISDQIILKIATNRFVISGKHHGISYEELKLMVDYLVSQSVVHKISRAYIYYIAGFLLLNYGSNYIFMTLLNQSSDVSLFGALYIIFGVAAIIYCWDRITLIKLRTKEEHK